MRDTVYRTNSVCWGVLIQRYNKPKRPSIGNGRGKGNFREGDPQNIRSNFLQLVGPEKHNTSLEKHVISTWRNDL